MRKSIGKKFCDKIKVNDYSFVYKTIFTVVKEKVQYPLSNKCSTEELKLSSYVRCVR